MRILFVHQNFPGQFKFLAPAVAADSRNEVVALTMNTFTGGGIRVCRYAPARGNSPEIHPWLTDLESKVIRGEATFRAALALRQEGFVPDVIVAHPGWGESLFLKEVWPKARLGLYCEYHYHAAGADVGFDPEFPVPDLADDERRQLQSFEACRLRLKNVNNLLHFDQASAGLAPTEWQKSRYPEPFRSRISVIHDGIDTEILRPFPQASLTLGERIVLRRDDPVLTFVNRTLEPCRGYHIFMRALPKILRLHPRVQVLIVGGTEGGYGPRPPDGRTWREVFFNEVSAGIVPDRVFFLGQIPYAHYVALLQLSSVHVYLTYPFVLSWSLLEAMSCACAIVASATPPVEEVIQHDLNGRLVDFFDPERLADEVLDLLESPAARERLGSRARAHVQAHFDVKQVCLPRQLKWLYSL